MHAMSDTAMSDAKLTRAELDAAERAIGRLPPLERTVVALLYYEGLTYGQAGQVLGIDAEAVESLHARALRRIRQVMAR